jgi:hypothetical protein
MGSCRRKSAAVVSRERIQARQAIPSAASEGFDPGVIIELMESISLKILKCLNAKVDKFAEVVGDALMVPFDGAFGCDCF